MVRDESIVVDGHADPGLWRPADHPDQALYCHRMVVRLDSRAQHLGAAILDWASRRAAALGKTWLRLDAWTSNPRPHQYHRNRGFRQIRTVDGPGIVSGVLFERPAGRVEDTGPAVTEHPAPREPE